VCIDDTPYVCSHIIFLSTPTIADVTKIAHREGVPNGALPKLGRVFTPLWGKATLPSTKKRSHLPRMCIFVPSTVMRICCCRELFLLQTQRIIGQARLYLYLWRYYSSFIVTLCDYLANMLLKFIIIMSVRLSRLYFIIYSHSAWLDYNGGWLSLLLLQSLWVIDFWICVDKFIIATNVPAVLMLCLHSSLLFTAASCNVCRHVSSWKLIHWETNSIDLVLTSANISWSSSEYDWTRSLIKIPLFMLDESHFVHWLLHVSCTSAAALNCLDIRSEYCHIGQDY